MRHFLNRLKKKKRNHSQLFERKAFVSFLFLFLSFLSKPRCQTNIYSFEKKWAVPEEDEELSRSYLSYLEGLALNLFQKQKSCWKMERKREKFLQFEDARANRCNKIFVVNERTDFPKRNGTFSLETKQRLKDWKYVFFQLLGKVPTTRKILVEPLREIVHGLF